MPRSRAIALAPSFLSRSLVRGPGGLRRAARRLELRHVGFVPEHFSLAEGLRASLAVGVPLALAVGLDQPGLAWAVFAAFWTCLGDGQGGDRPRRRLLGLFVGAGGAIALVGSLLAGLAPWAGVLVGPVLVFLSLAGAARVRFGGLVGTLLGVVAVVAVGFPQSPPAALAQALTFAGGGLWCWLLINGIWRIDARAALVRAGDGVLARLFDMAVSLVELGDGHHRDEDWHSDHGEHRRAVRLSIERLRALLERYPGQEAAIAPFERLRDAAETLFGAMIALDQAFIVHHGPVAERLATARAFRTTLLAWRLGAASGESLPWVERRLARLQAGLHDPLFVGCVVAQRRALQVLCAPDEQPAEPVSGGPVGVQGGGQESGQEGPPQRRSLIPQWTLPQPALRQALRQTAGLVAVYALAALFHLGYPYWATMAVVVVLQGGARVTWARCLERIVGSLLGGTVAMVLLLLFGTVSTPVFAALAVVLAGVTIAMRQVNYTLFVVFLTMLFVIVTQILHPGEGVAAARMADNVLGSVAALLAVFTLWPDFGASLQERIAQGIAANMAYGDAVRAGAPSARIRETRRRAGLASIEAELALHDVGGLLPGSQRADGSALRELRTIAGEAAMAWHSRMGQMA